jgi:hypothetical protein
VLLLSFVSPPYAAVIKFDPTASVDVLYVAIPPLIVAVPSVVPAFLNVTVPVAVVGESAAMNVTEIPYVDGFADEVSVTVVLTLFTVWVSAEDVLLLSFVSPPYAAVIEFDPTASVEVLYVAVPLLIVPVPKVALPFLNVTVPVAVEGESVAVNVTELP